MWTFVDIHAECVATQQEASSDLSSCLFTVDWSHTEKLLLSVSSASVSRVVVQSNPEGEP